MLEQRDCAQQLIELGQKCYAANLYSGDKRFLYLDFRPLLSPFPYLLFLDQTKTESILRERLQHLNVSVERGVDLTDFRDTGDAVETVLRHRDGHEEHLSTPYLIGCDGAHSFVREHLELGFEGRTFPQTFTLADLHVEWARPDDELHVFASDEGLTAVFPLGHGVHRLVADFLGKPEHERPSLEECQAILDRRLHAPPRVSDLSWSSYFHVNSRRVERLRAGRVFVAGDASHIHSPAAGQGMNTGIQESFNLAWKIALVLRGEADDKLLDTYDEERRRIERDVLGTTDIVTNVVGARQGFAAFFRDHIAPYFLGTALAQSYLRRFVTETEIEYSSSRLTFERSLKGGVRAGERAPDADIEVLAGPANRGEHRVFELLSSARFALLLLVDPNAPSKPEGVAEALSSAIPSPIDVWTISDNGGTQPRDDLAQQYGASRPSFYIVRPDGYVMARGKPDDAAAAAEFCKEAFTT